MSGGKDKSAATIKIIIAVNLFFALLTATLLSLKISTVQQHNSQRATLQKTLQGDK